MTGSKKTTSKKVMTKKEFAKRWDSDEDGGGITYEEIADCAIAWGITSHPRRQPMDYVASRVVAASGARDQF